MGRVSPIFLYGPTAAGKTALAIALAKQTDGVVINADSMQLYHDLRVVTARPSSSELAQAEHWGFGIIDASMRWSTKAWLDHAHRLLARADQQGRQPIFVGGTGLYHKALTAGLSSIPEPRPSVANACQALEMEALKQALFQIDPASAHLQDRQRMVRALAVSKESGQPFSYWVKKPLEGAVPDVKTFVLNPDRDQLRDRINRRFEEMIAQGAIEEVRQLAEQKLSPHLPAMRAIGVPELLAFLAGGLTRNEAIQKAQASSRQYAKRQLTWSRNQMKQAIKLPVKSFSAKEMERNISYMFSFLDGCGLFGAHCNSVKTN